MLQTDHKILTGVLAARLKRTVKHTISPQQYAASPRKITHAITQARDCAYLIIVTDATDAVSVNFSGRCKFLLI